MSDTTRDTTSLTQCILEVCNIFPTEVTLFQSNNRVDDYLLDERFMLRISKTTLDEIKKLNMVQNVSKVQKIHYQGNVIFENQTYEYVILDYFQGKDLYETIPQLNETTSLQIGKEIALVMKEIHQIKGDYYDIGHYIATIPRYDFSWKSGHVQYVELLENQTKQIPLSEEHRSVIESAFAYIKHHIDSLDYEQGPVLLHNDLHPKNIIINQKSFEGIIDWECAQFGEFDFEFSHLLHWCIYPSDYDRSFSKLLSALMKQYASIWSIPRLEERLTIYQLEHEINQIVWSGGNEPDVRIKRLNGWLSGELSRLLNDMREG